MEDFRILKEKQKAEEEEKEEKDKNLTTEQVPEGYQDQPLEETKKSINDNSTISNVNKVLL